MRAAALLLASTLGVAPAAPGQNAGNDGVEIHGFGEWAYAETDGHRYLIGSNDGRYQNASLSLNLAYRKGDLSIVGQLQVEQNPIVEESEIDVSLDYAFLEWNLSDSLRLRAGRAKHPFGIYAEIFDVGTLRPFYLLPQGIYGPQGFTAQFYDGVGITGSSGDSWAVSYDVYFGQIQGDARFPGPLSGDPSEVLESIVDLGFTVRDTIGGRLTVHTPVDGLNFGVSAYRGDQIVNAGDTSNPGVALVDERETNLAHLEFLNDKWSIRTEVASSDGSGSEIDAAYFEAAYHLDDHWQLAARWDDSDVTLKGLDTSMFPPFFTQVLESTDIAFGINYWFAPNAVLKLSYHATEGNRFAFPGEPLEIVQTLLTGTLEDETEMVVFGTQFSF